MPEGIQGLMVSGKIRKALEMWPQSLTIDGARPMLDGFAGADTGECAAADSCRTREKQIGEPPRMAVDLHRKLIAG